jgi:hypothetical protein
MTLTRRFALALLVFVVLLSGCSKSQTPSRVSGKVTYKGQPVPAGTITFHIPEGGIFYYPLSPDGTYSGANLPATEMVVTVETESVNPKGHPQMAYGGKAAKGKTGNDPNDYMAKMKERGMVPQGAIAKGEYVKIPAKYADKATSPLKVNLTKGNNVNDFELTD